jgi:hypothetical protein
MPLKKLDSDDNNEATTENAEVGPRMMFKFKNPAYSEVSVAKTGNANIPKYVKFLKPYINSIRYENVASKFTEAEIPLLIVEKLSEDVIAD